MLQNLLFAWALVALTVAIHATGIAVMARRMLRVVGAYDTGLWRITALLVRVAWQLIILHLLEIAVWALFYWWQDCLPDLESSFYFSGVTYATVGYGDIVLPQEWRLFGPTEGLTGILMCGLSVSFFFVIVSTVFRVNAESTTHSKV